ncbi:MAG: protein phosphatase 2C domain-containing protein [Bacteroidota bacterium]
MKVYIKQPVALHEAGNQSLNEDFVYPLVSQVNAEERLFIVCDGQGGANAGDVASKLVALNLAKYFASYPPKGEVDQDYLDNALQFVEQKLSNYKANHPESLSMSTGMAMLYLGERQITMAWAGNCDITYFNAASQKLIPTRDATDTKEVQISGSEQPTKIQMRFLPNEEIGAGDFFFLSSSGIKEHVDDATLTTLFESGTNPKNSPAKLIEEIRILNQGFAKDNFSCYLVQIDKVSESSRPKAVVAEGAAAHATTDTVNSGSTGEGMARTLTFAGVIAILACLVGLAAYWGRSAKGFDEYMSTANQSVIDSDYAGAVASYDSALLVASNAEERQKAMMAMEDAKANLTKLQAPNIEIAPEELTESAKMYIDLAQDDFKAGAYLDAAKNYQKAQGVIERDSLKEPEIPFEEMAHAFLMAGNEVYEGDATDCAFS